MQTHPLPRSNALESAGYSTSTRTLRVCFRHGGVYDYLDAGPEVIAGLRSSAHPWTEWRERILSLKYRRVE